MNAASKSEYLARHRTFHLGHAHVTDPLFEVDGFFDPRDLLLVKYEMLRRVRVDGWSVSRATREAALSRTAWYDAMHRWEKQGLVGLQPDSPGPRPHAIRPLIDITVSTGPTDGPQKGGAISAVPDPVRGTCGMKPSEKTGCHVVSRVQSFSCRGKVCWPGCAPHLATTHPRFPSRCDHGVKCHERPSWIVNWSPRSSNSSGTVARRGHHEHR